MKSRRTEITIETEEIWVIRRSRGAIIAWCQECGEQVEMVTPDQAAGLTRLGARRRVGSEGIHYAETSQGCLLICLRSMVQLRAGGPDRHQEDSYSEERE
jgi:hypothetical protein